LNFFLFFTRNQFPSEQTKIIGNSKEGKKHDTLEECMKQRPENAGKAVLLAFLRRISIVNRIA